MGFDEGRIVLNSDTGIYYAGQTVFGKLIFDQEKEKTFRGIYAKIKGFCKVHWRSSHSRTVHGKRETYYVDHNSHEEYINQKIYLIGSENSEQQIQPGHYEFPFQCVIPPNCPSSFEGTHGHIRYEVKVIVDRAFKMDQEKKAAIRVIAPLDLNVAPDVKETVQLLFDETYYCCCTSSGTVQAVIKLPAAGYCPGQVIPIEIRCDNKSSVTIDSITFVLKKETKFHAQGTKSESEKVAEVAMGEVRPNTSRNYTAELHVPNVHAPNVRGCRYIDIDYRLKVTLSPDGCHSDSSKSHDIIIGTIPLAGVPSYPAISQDQMAQENVPVVNQPVPSPYPGPGVAYPGGQPPYFVDKPQPSQSPYPGGNVSNPGGNPPYPHSNPYPSNTPYPTPGITPYPTSGITPYPTPGITPYPSANPPQGGNAYPTTNPPYPPPYSESCPVNPPYPVGPTASPYPPSTSPYPATSTTTGLKTGTFGFAVQGTDNKGRMPLLPPHAAVPYPVSPSSNPYAAATAPDVTPSDESSKM